MRESYYINAAGRRIREVCKNCSHCTPCYKTYRCELTKKRTRLADSCEDWRAK